MFWNNALDERSSRDRAEVCRRGSEPAGAVPRARIWIQPGSLAPHAAGEKSFPHVLFYRDVRSYACRAGDKLDIHAQLESRAALDDPAAFSAGGCVRRLGGACCSLPRRFFYDEVRLRRWQWRALVQILTLFGPNLLGGPLGEESGWRGYALPRLQRRFSPLASFLILGFIWANWHLPLMLAHLYNVTWWQFVLVTMAASVFLSFAFNKSGGSTACAIVVHGIYNIGTGIILNDFIGKATLRSNAVQHNVFWMAYAGVAALLCIITRGQLGYHRDAGGS
jgi:Type II CAAX prenyl endopeptidase Rce1-like